MFLITFFTYILCVNNLEIILDDLIFTEYNYDYCMKGIIHFNGSCVNFEDEYIYCHYHDYENIENYDIDYDNDLKVEINCKGSKIYYCSDMKYKYFACGYKSNNDNYKYSQINVKTTGVDPYTALVVILSCVALFIVIFTIYACWVKYHHKQKRKERKRRGKITNERKIEKREIRIKNKDKVRIIISNQPKRRNSILPKLHPLNLNINDEEENKDANYKEDLVLGEENKNKLQKI